MISYHWYGDIPYVIYRGNQTVFYRKKAWIDHRNIIKTFLIHDAGHSIFIITELARSDLLDYIQLNGALRETLCRRLFYDLASGVEYMHSINLVHRDIKRYEINVFGSSAGSDLIF